MDRINIARFFYERIFFYTLFIIFCHFYAKLIFLAFLVWLIFFRFLFYWKVLKILIESHFYDITIILLYNLPAEAYRSEFFRPIADRPPFSFPRATNLGEVQLKA